MNCGKGSKPPDSAVIVADAPLMVYSPMWGCIRCIATHADCVFLAQKQTLVFIGNFTNLCIKACLLLQQDMNLHSVSAETTGMLRCHIMT